MPHPVIWYEVIGKDSAALSKFYAELFGWKVDPAPQNYFMFTAEGDQPNGGVGEDPSGGNGHVTFYAQTDDLQTSLDKAESLGGRTVMPPTEPMEGTTIALFADPGGTWSAWSSRDRPPRDSGGAYACAAACFASQAARASGVVGSKSA